MFPIVLYKNLETFSPFVDAVANECVEGLFHSSPGVGQLVDSLKLASWVNLCL